MTSIEEAKQLLYGQPLESFVAERNALAKQVRASGERALANEIKALRKPSAVAAEVNELVRSDPSSVELILQAAELLRDAQTGALEGSEVHASELQTHYRAAIQALFQTATTRRPETRAAFEAAIIDEASHDDLRGGWLVTAPTPVSIFGMAEPSLADTETPDKEPPVDELEERRSIRRAAQEKEQEEAARKQAEADAARKQEEERKQKEERKQEEERKQKEKEQKAQRAKERKALKTKHRAALRTHLAALDAEEVAAVESEQAASQIVDLERERQQLTEKVAELQLQVAQAIQDRDQLEQARVDAGERAIAAEAEVEALTDAIAALEE